MRANYYMQFIYKFCNYRNIPLRAIYLKLLKWSIALTLFIIVFWINRSLPSNATIVSLPSLTLNATTVSLPSLTLNATTVSLPPLPPNVENKVVQQPFVLISALYNSKSRYYSDKKFVLLINAPVDGMIESTTFVAKSTNGTDHYQQNFVLFLAAPPNIVCKWTTYMAVFDSVENPKSLEIGFGSKSVPVEFQLPYLKKRVQVGTCFSPIFFAENWQLVVLAIEIYRHYGIKLQVVYLMSAIDGIFEILKAYNSKDVIEIEQWPSIKLEDQKYNNINLELDWRNQASAHTDCLMKYGYAAEFLIVGDLDDILVPDHGNYYEEFIRNDYRHKKNAVALLYARYTVDINTTRKAANFSLFDALTTAKVAMYQPDDPKYVVNTSRAESLWIHWPYKIKPNTATRLVPSTEGRMLHFRNWHYSDETGNSTDNYMHMNVKNSVLWRSVALNESFISTKSARQMGKRFEKDIFKRNFGLFRNLPKQLHYFDQITKCYDKIFYSNDKQVTDCPGPHHCSVSPVNGLNCVIAKRAFIGQNLAPNIVLYISPNKGKFHFSNVGCSL